AGVFQADIASLAAACDVLIIAAPGGEATSHIVDAGVLAALGKDGILVNIARGSLVDEPALVAALQNGTIAGAGLDVFADEPAVPDALK
ncbi:NAD(P)-dependent oxidoreductase, partial [Pseudomonas aeruginosa]